MLTKKVAIVSEEKRDIRATERKKLQALEYLFRILEDVILNKKGLQMFEFSKNAFNLDIKLDDQALIW